LGPDWKVNENEKAPIVIANHASFVDNMVMIMKYYPRFIAKISFKSMPFVNIFADSLNTLYLKRVGTNVQESRM
jgi:1-acyl-sn-glycerol-3-phosphate acyltransferase